MAYRPDSVNPNDTHDVALICLNGHAINGSSRRHPQWNTKFCERCGEPNVNRCPSCELFIRGDYHEGTLVMEDSDVPSFCHSCGNPFVWTQRRIKAAQDLVEFSEELGNADKKELQQAIAEVSKDSPQARVAVKKINFFSAKLSPETKGMLRDIVSALTAEALKVMLKI